MQNMNFNASSVSLYLIIVLFIGPILLKGKKPYDFPRVLFVYNAVLVLLNLYIMYEVR
jgi:hypothetical protein